MSVLRKVIGWCFIISAYVGCAITLIHGLFSVLGGTFNWRLLLMALTISLLMYVGGSYLKEGSVIFRVDQEELERLREKAQSGTRSITKN